MAPPVRPRRDVDVDSTLLRCVDSEKNAMNDGVQHVNSNLKTRQGEGQGQVVQVVLGRYRSFGGDYDHRSPNNSRDNQLLYEEDKPCEQLAGVLSRRLPNPTQPV